MLAVLGSRKARSRTLDALRASAANISVKRIASVVTAVVATYAIALGFNHWLYSPQVWPIREVRVSGAFVHVQESDLSQILAGLRGQNLFACDLEAVKDAIKRHPWIDSVAVRRQWPGAVAVEIKEQQAFARWLDGGLVNVRGERFVPAQHTIPQGLPVFQGPGGREREMVERYRDLSAALAPVRLRLEALTLDSRGAWRAQMDNGLKVVIGRRLDERRISRFVRTYPRVIAPALARVEQVDLRYPNGFAVRWRPDEITAM